jgi:glycosyltransferase involved in cell wall biosynthesis
MIETLRTNGQYEGPVHILTDKPSDFACAENVATIPIAAGQDVIAIKTYKTRLRDLIDAKEILYLDVDVLIGAPLRAWHEQIREKVKRFPIAVFRDTGTGTGRYHTGAIFMTSATDPFLLRWRDALMSGEYTRDQEAFQEATQPDSILLMPEKHLLFPDIECMRNRRVRTFVHITFTGRQRIFSLLTIRHYVTSTFHCRHVPENCRLAALSKDYIKRLARKSFRVVGAKTHATEIKIVAREWARSSRILHIFRYRAEKHRLDRFVQDNQHPTKRVLILDLKDGGHKELLPSLCYYFYTLGYELHVFEVPQTCIRRGDETLRGCGFTVLHYEMSFFSPDIYIQAINSMQFDCIFIPSFTSPFKIMFGRRWVCELVAKHGVFDYAHDIRNLRNKCRLSPSCKKLKSFCLAEYLETSEVRSLPATFVHPGKPVARIQKAERIVLNVIGASANHSLIIPLARSLNQAGLQGKYRIRVVGKRWRKGRRRALAEEILEHSLQENITILGELGCDVLHQLLTRSDFLLPLLDSSIASHSRYSTTKSSGGFGLIFGYQLIPIIELAFAEAWGIVEESVHYQNASCLTQAVKTVVENPQQYSHVKGLIHEKNQILLQTGLQNLKHALRGERSIASGKEA